MKVTKQQLRNIVREAVRRKLAEGPSEVFNVGEPLKIEGPFVTFEQLQQVIDEELEKRI